VTKRERKRETVSFCFAPYQGWVRNWIYHKTVKTNATKQFLNDICFANKAN
jgi:hypothetical protein